MTTYTITEQNLKDLISWSRTDPNRCMKALENLQPNTQTPVEANYDEVICPSCCTQFRAIPVNVQRLMLDAGFEPPFTHPAPQQKPLTDEQIDVISLDLGMTGIPLKNRDLLQFARAIEAAHGVKP